MSGPHGTSPAGRVSQGSGPHGIALHGVAATKGRFALRDVTFSLPEGAFGVVIGPAGSGKTTLLEVVAGLLAPTAGTLTLGGRDAKGRPPEERDVGLVYQHAFLFPHLSVRENVGYGSTDAAALEEAIARMGVEPLLAREVRGLSGANGRWSPSPAPSRVDRRCCSSTSPSAHSIRADVRSSDARCAPCIAPGDSPRSR